VSSPPAGSGFAGFLQENAGQHPTAVEPLWKMQVLTPTERKIYEWSDLKQLPVETTIAGSGTTSGTPAATFNPTTPGTGAGNSDTNTPTSGDDNKPSPGKDSK
jgi:hypothetical protein